MPEQKPGQVNWSDLTWALAMGAQGGLLVAVPVLLGLGLGYLLDRYFSTLPWFSVAGSLVGGVVGPVSLYRWARERVQQRLSGSLRDEENDSSAGKG